MPLSVTYDPSITVVHASHHGIQTLLGVVAKKLYGASLIVWDHGMQLACVLLKFLVLSC